MTWRDLLKSGTEKLKNAGIGEASYDAKSLLFHASGLNLTTYALRAGDEVPEGGEGCYRELLERRAKREPLQYIFGTAPFYGRDFIVGQGVLVPRFDTETLVEALAGLLKPGMKILDLCTGSGCILLTLLLEGPEGLTGTGVDISEEALFYARKNAEKFGAAASFLQGDLFEGVTGTWDMISANPPYIRKADIGGLAPEVADFEPENALDGGEDGLDYMRKITGAAPKYLKPGGILGLEIGYDQSEDVVHLMKENGFGSISVKRDLSWNTRAVIGHYME